MTAQYPDYRTDRIKLMIRRFSKKDQERLFNMLGKKYLTIEELRLIISGMKKPHEDALANINAHAAEIEKLCQIS